MNVKLLNNACHARSRAFGGEDWAIAFASQHHDKQIAPCDAEQLQIASPQFQLNFMAFIYFIVGLTMKDTTLNLISENKTIQFEINSKLS